MSHGNSRFVLLGFLVSALVAAPPQVLGDVTSQTWISRGTAVYQQIGNTLGIPGSSLFAEVASLGGGQSGGSDGTAYAWPLSTMLRVDGSLAALNPVKYDPVLLGLSNQFYSQYWNAAGGGYQSGTATGSTIYYDDNAHVAVALAQDYQITGNPVYLTRAEQTEAFVLSGSDSAGGGGIYWTAGCGSKDSIATLQGARAALLIYESTGQNSYLTDATQLYNWAASHTQQSNGLFMQGYSVSGSNANTAQGTPLVNAAGIGISCNVQFYKATHNASYLAEAETIANTTLGSYFNSSTGAINDEGYWAFELTDGLLDLYQVDHNARWLNATTGGMQYLYSDMRDPNGNYGLYWGRGGPQVGALSSWDLNNQAPVARAYLYLGQALAVSSTWAVATSGSWAAGSNWTANSPPANGDGTNVYIETATNSPSLLNITLDGQQTVGTIYLSNTASQTTGYNITSGSAGGSQLLVLSNTANSAQVIVTSGMHAISAPVSLASNLVISLSSSSTLAISGNIAGTGQSLTLAYGGSLVLSGANTYSGGTNISGGTVSVSADNNLGGASGGLALGTGGTLLSTASFTTNRGMTLSSGGGIFAQDSGTISLTASGPISGSGGLTQAGPGTLVLTASNTYSGATAVSGGTLSVGNGGNGASIGSTSGITLSNGANLTFNHGDAVTWNHVITGNGSFTDTGTGTLTLTAAQSYSGPTIVGGGVLKLDSSSPLAYTEYRFTPTKVYSGTQLQMSELQYYLPSGTRVQANSVSSSAITWGDSPVSNINDNNTATKYGTDNGVNIPIVFTFTSPRAFTSYNWATGNDTSTYTGRNPVRWTVQASNNGINWVTLDDKSGADQSVTFANSTFQTGWTLSNTGGVSSNTLPITTALTIGANATLDLGGGSQQVASLSDYAPGSGGSIINSNTGAATALTLSPTGGSTTFSGMIQGGSTLGTISLVISGSGTQVLAGTNTYSGGTTVGAGKLVVSGSLGNTAVTVSGGATLGGTGTIGGSVTVAGGSSPSTWGTISLADGAANTLTLSDAISADTVLTIGGNTAGSTSLLCFEVGATADRIQATAGKLVVNPGGAMISITSLPGFAPGTYDLLGFANGQASGLGYLNLVTTSLNGYTLSLRSTPTAEQLVVAVPEPSALALLGVGAISLLACTLRRKSTRT
jgi:autotransporter-associated beta strand protein